MTKIKGKLDGPGGRNEHYDIGKRKNVPRTKVVKEIEAGVTLVLPSLRSKVGNTLEITLILLKRIT